MSASSVHTVSGSPAQRAAPAGGPAAPSLPDVLRVLDLDALATIFGGLSNSDLASFRLACRALRDACTAGVRELTVMVSHSQAQDWRPGQRSPLALFPWCSHLTLMIDTNTSHNVSFRRDDDSDDNEEVGEGYGDAGYSHDLLARLAVAGASAEGLARITHLTILGLGYRYYSRDEGFDLAGVLCVLAPQLPGLELLDAADLSTRPLDHMEAGDSAPAALMHQALGQHCPRLRELRLPSAPGVLRGVGALAACGSLQELEMWEGCGCAVLGSEEVAGLSRLRQLRTLKLACHDRSSGGANLAALLGHRRPPQLVNLELAASVRVDGAGGAAAGDNHPRRRRLQLPCLEVEFQPGPGHMRDVHVVPEKDSWRHGGVLAFDRAAEVLVAAAERLPHPVGSSRAIRSLRLAWFPVSKNAGTEQEFLRCLGPAGWLAKLAARCDSVEVKMLDAPQAVSTRAAGAVLGVLGLPDTLELRHGVWTPFDPVAQPPQQQLPPLPRSAAGGEMSVQQQPAQSVQPLQLESATAEDVLREVVERLWLAAAATAATEGAGSAASEGSSSGFGGCSSSATGGRGLLHRYSHLLLRHVPEPQAPLSTGGILDEDWPQWLDTCFGGRMPPAAAAAVGSDAPAAAAALGSGAGAPAAAAAVGPGGGAASAAPTAADVAAGAAAGGGGGGGSRRTRTHPSHYVDIWESHESIPCADAVLVSCCSAEDAAALAAIVTAPDPVPGTAAAAAAAVTEDAASASASASVGGCKCKLQIAARPFPCDTNIAGLLERSVMQVLMELWNGGAGGSEGAGGRERMDKGGAGGRGAPVGGPGKCRILTRQQLSRLQRLLDLDAGVIKLYRAAV